MKKSFIPLENNPEVMTPLAIKLGLSPRLAFYDVYSFSQELLSYIPRPNYALIVVIPLTPAWDKTRKAENESKTPYEGSGAGEPVVWFKQTIGNACGLVGLLHALCNLPVAEPANRDFLADGSDLVEFLRDALPLNPVDRGQLLYDSAALEAAHASAATKGDTEPPNTNVKLGLHFVTFVKGKDGHLWELEGGGGRTGPLDRGKLGDDDDMLSENALEQGILRYVDMERQAGGDLRFSCIALCPAGMGEHFGGASSGSDFVQQRVRH